MLNNSNTDLGAFSREERWVYAAIAFTFIYYFLGALYLLAPILGWSLLLLHVSRYFFSPQPIANNYTSWLSWLWFSAIILLLLTLVLGHVNFGLGLSKTIKSTVGWAKGWALLALFIFAGTHLRIRSEVVIRAACVVGLCALITTPILVAAYFLNLPSHVYVSPLKILGGSGPEYFTVVLFEIDPGNNSPRWRYFAPWAPAVGFVANIYFLCSLFENNNSWRIVGLTGNMLMIILAVSRMGLLVMLLVPLTVYFSSRLTRPWVWIFGAICIFLMLAMFDPLTTFVDTFIASLKDARADSTRVRAALNDMAIYLWEKEAFWFGHGVVERGSHFVEFMPIGSHHNWFGLLFVKGLIGLIAFGIPFLVTGVVLLYKSQCDKTAQLGFALFLVITFFSMSENIEALAYMTWPAWLVMGIALKVKPSGTTEKQLKNN